MNWRCESEPTSFRSMKSFAPILPTRNSTRRRGTLGASAKGPGSWLVVLLVNPKTWWIS